MTGHGRGLLAEGSLAVTVEMRSINNRFLKITIANSDQYSWVEQRITALIRSVLQRGTVHVTIQIDDSIAEGEYELDSRLINHYAEQYMTISGEIDKNSIPWAALLSLPGVVRERTRNESAREEHWSLIEKAAGIALEQLAEMRAEEGRAMQVDLENNIDSIRTELVSIAARAPEVIKDYTKKLSEKINHLLQPFEAAVSPAELVREVGLIAERWDISEEILRLQSHLDQFEAVLKGDTSDGRKLEFITQELLRETNTIGSKANDAAIAQHVVEIKTLIERIREMTQNVE